MNLLDVMLNAQNGAAVRQVGAQLGLPEDKTAAALKAIAPALASGVQRNMQSPDGLAGLLNALSSGGHQKYLEDPSALTNQQAVVDGNGILGHIFGSKEVSREVASRAAAQAGVGTDVMKQLLPLAAAMMMGAMSRQQSAPGGAAGMSGSGLAGMLSSLVDQNRDGSIVDDIGGMIGRAFRQS